MQLISMQLPIFKLLLLVLISLSVLFYNLTPTYTSHNATLAVILHRELDFASPDYQFQELSLVYFMNIDH